MFLKLRWTGALVSALLLVHFAGGAEVIRVSGSVARPAEWTVERLKESFAGQLHEVKYEIKGEKHTSSCIPLWAVVNAAQPASDPAHKHWQLRLAIAVLAGDGYAACFGFGELSPEGGNREAWLALDMDGKPLPEKEGPIKLIVPGDASPVRWVRNVRAIRITDGAANGAATRPAST